MSLDLHDCTVAGPALPEPFLRFELPDLLTRLGLLPKPSRSAAQGWDTLRRTVRTLAGEGGPLRVHNHVIAPLAPCLGYGPPQRQEPVATREGPEDGGWSMQTAGGARLRTWSVGADTSLDAPHPVTAARIGSAPPAAPSRVLLSCGEAAGLLTDGTELRSCSAILPAPTAI